MSPPDGTTMNDGGTATSGGASSATTTSTTTANSGGTASSSGTTTTSGGTATSGTTTSGGTATTTTTTQTSPWADDWRKSMAKGDDAGIKRLERYKDPEAVYDALVNAQKRIDSGQIKATLPENATPEQITEYRKANGIPEAPDKYDTNIGEGHVWGEADKPLLDGFLKTMHDQNATPSEVSRALKWYGSLAQQQAEAKLNADATFRQESTAELGKRYGGDFKRNIAHVDAYLEEFPPGIKDKVLGARLPNGRLAGSDPDFIDFLFQQAIFKNPIATVMGGNSETQIKAGQARLNELIKMSGDPNSEYNKGATRHALRDEHLKLIDDLEKVKGQQR